MSIPTDKIFLGYWRLYCAIHGIKICRKCGVVLDAGYVKRRRGKLCMTCKVEDTLAVARGIDIIHIL